MQEHVGVAASEPRSGRDRALHGIPALGDLVLTDPLAEAVACAVLCPVLLAAAIWNGFPIIFYDTGAYLLEGLGRVFLAERSPVYSLFLRYAGAGASLWLVALLQAAMTAFVMVQTARAVAPKLGLWPLLGIAAGLVLLTGLPWYVGEIEPDCFTALVILSLFLLAFHEETLVGVRRAIVIAIAVLAIGAHPSDVLLGGGLVLALLAYRGAVFLAHGTGWPRAAALRPFLCCVLGLCLVVASNFNLTGKLFVSRAGPAFVFARMLQDGIVMRLLDDTCPQSHYRLCGYKDVLPRTADQWLWGRDSPFFKMDRFTGTSAESTRIIWDSLKRYPVFQAETALADAARQFTTFRTGDQIEPQEWILSRPLAQFIPGQMRAYLGARQQEGEIDFRPINRVHVSLGWFALAGLAIAIVLALVRRRRRDAVLLVFVLVALIGNAVICGALSNPHDRYQSRLLWLVPFALVLIEAKRPHFALRG
ncbi:MAG: hypothetical protein ACLQUZ_08335 [Rhizomicrobium sp.]